MSVIIINRKQAMLEERAALATAKIVKLFDDTGENRRAVYKIMEEVLGELVDAIEEFPEKRSLTPDGIKKSEIKCPSIKYREKEPTTQETLDRVIAAARENVFDVELGQISYSEDYDPFGDGNVNERLAKYIIEGRPLPAESGPERDGKIKRFFKRILG